MVINDCETGSQEKHAGSYLYLVAEIILTDSKKAPDAGLLVWTTSVLQSGSLRCLYSRSLLWDFSFLPNCASLTLLCFYKKKTIYLLLCIYGNSLLLLHLNHWSGFVPVLQNLNLSGFSIVWSVGHSRRTNESKSRFLGRTHGTVLVPQGFPAGQS